MKDKLRLVFQLESFKLGYPLLNDSVGQAERMLLNSIFNSPLCALIKL